MELKNLRTFLQIADSGNFSKAAEKLGYTQSTVSFQIKQLEDELGCMLFDRIGKRVQLTANGEKLLKHAYAITGDMRALEEEFLREEKISGKVHMFSSDSICERMMLLNYHDFYSRYPGIQLIFSTGDTIDLLKVLDRNEADIIFTLDTHIYQPEYIIAKESPVSLNFIVNSAHPLAKENRAVEIGELMKYPFILTEKGMSYRKVLDNYLAEKSVKIEPVLETGRTDIILTTLKKGNGVAFLPDFITDEMVSNGTMKRIEVKDIKLTIWKQLIYHRDKWISKPLSLFIEYVKAHEFEW